MPVIATEKLSVANKDKLLDYINRILIGLITADRIYSADNLSVESYVKSR